jgi:phage terminase large subunit-like protein
VFRFPSVISHMSEPTKKLMELALLKRIRHAGHPILRWNINCVRVKGDDARQHQAGQAASQLLG